MKPKYKFILKSPLWGLRCLSIIRVASKHIKDRSKYNKQFRNDFLAKKAQKLFNDFNIKLKIFGYSNLPKKGNALLVPNHIDNSDGFAIILGLKKQTFDKNEQNKIPTFLAKNELKAKKITKSVMDILDTFYIERKNLKQSYKAINDLVEYTKEFKTFPVVFPAGTRSKDDTIGKFRPSSFKIAKKGFFNIIPVTINNSLNSFNKSRKEPITIEIYFHKLIKASEIVSLDPKSISERVYKIINSKFKKPIINDEIKALWKDQNKKDKKYKEKVFIIEQKEKQKIEKKQKKEEKLIKKLAAKEKIQAEKEIAKDKTLREKLIEKKTKNKNSKKEKNE